MVLQIETVHGVQMARNINSVWLSTSVRKRGQDVPYFTDANNNWQFYTKISSVCIIGADNCGYRPKM